MDEKVPLTATDDGLELLDRLQLPTELPVRRPRATTDPIAYTGTYTDPTTATNTYAYTDPNARTLTITNARPGWWEVATEGGPDQG